MKFLKIFLAFLLGTSAIAQTASYSDFSSTSFEGIKTEDGKLFYSTYYGTAKPDTPYSYVIQTFNPELQRVANVRVSVKYLSDIVDVAEHNGGLLFYIKSGSDGLIYYFDETGKKAWDKTMEMDKGKFTDVKLLSAGAEGIVVLRPDKEDKNGFRISLYDNEMNEKWSHGYFPDKGSISPGQLRIAGDKIAVRSYYSRGFFSSKFEENVHVFSTKDGSLQYKQVVADEEKEGKPEDFKLNADGSTFFIGYVIDSRSEATHLFYTAFDGSGKELYRQQFSIKDELAKDLTSSVARQNFGFEEPPMINFQHIQKTENGYEILGETYKYIEDPAPKPAEGVAVSTTSSSGKFYVMDYVVLDISNTGKLNPIRRIGKPHKRITTKGHSVGKEIYADEYFEKFNLFATRFINDNGDLVSLNWSRNTPYIGYTSLSSAHENILNRIYLDKTVSERETGEYTDYTFVKEGMQKPLETFHYNILPYNAPGKFLFYDFEGGELSMEVMELKTEPAKPSDRQLALTGIPGQSFNGLMPVEGKGYYTFYFSETMDEEDHLYIYHRLDKEMNTTGRSVLVVPATASFAGDVPTADGQVIVFQDRSERSWYLYALDNNGNLKGQNRIALNAEAPQLPTGNLLLETAADGFYMIQPYIDTVREINGYEVIRLNADREVRWTWSHEAGENEMLQLISTDAGEGIFTVLHTQRNYKSFNEVDNMVMVIDDAAGTLRYEHNLFDGKDSGFPEYVKVAPDKSVVTSGMYFPGKEFDSRNSEGIFFLKLDKQGGKTLYTKLPWTQVEEKLQVSGDADFLVSGRTKVLVQDMILMPDGSYKVIGELYRKSAGTTGAGFLLGGSLADRAFSIYDFVVFDFDKAGKFGSVYRIPKEEQNIELPGNIGYQRGLALSMIMRKHNMFSYHKTLASADKPQLIFTNTIDERKSVFKAPVTETTITDFPSAPAEYIVTQPEEKMNKLEMLDSKLEQFGKDLDKMTKGTDQVFTSYTNPHKGFAVSVPEEVLVYSYDRETGVLNLKLESLK